MSLAYTRPFHPLDFTNQAAAAFSLDEMIDQLRHEPVHQTANRNALTLVHDHCLSVVLTVVREGAQCEEHFSPEPTIFVVIEGELAIEPAAGGETVYLTAGSVGALARNVSHKLTATTDCAYLMVIGGSHDDSEKAAVRKPKPIVSPMRRRPQQGGHRRT